METIHFPDDARPPWLVHPVLALGNFDGLHRGHLKIIERPAWRRRAWRHADGDDLRSSSTARSAAGQGTEVADDESPAARVASPRGHQLRGGRAIHSRVAEWDPETFVRTVLVDWLRVSEVWVGANFLFGHGRSGNFTVLRTLGQHYGFRADKIDPHVTKISS